METQDFANNLFAFMEETLSPSITAFILTEARLFLKLSQRFRQKKPILGGKCASLAAQVAHVIFYIRSWERYAWR